MNRSIVGKFDQVPREIFGHFNDNWHKLEDIVPKNCFTSQFVCQFESETLYLILV